MNYKTAIEQLNSELAKHNQTSSFENSSNNLNPRSPSVQMLNQKHADKKAVSSRGAFKQSRSADTPTGHLPTLAQLTAQAQASALKPKK